MKSCASAFIVQNRSQEDISELGKELVVDLAASLKDTVHYHHCAISISPRKWLVQKHLSPLKGFPQLPLQPHSIAYVCTAKLWCGCRGMANDTKPTDWGWKEESRQLIRVMTEKNAAPDELLKVIHCNCLVGCKSSRCSCRRYALPCIACSMLSMSN